MSVKPEFSVVTVVKENPEGLLATYQSLKVQNFSPWEMIIIGTSLNDKTALVAHEIIKSDNRVVFYTEIPKGIYSAMNLGTEKAKGLWIWYMNAGDCFADYSTLTDVAVVFSKNRVDTIIGNHIFQNDPEPRRRLKRNRHISKLQFAFNLRISHQAIIFTRQSIVVNNGYNTKFTYVADSELVLRIMKSKSALSIPRVLAIVENGGFSDQNLEDLYLEKHEMRKGYFKNSFITFCSFVWTMLLKLRLKTF